jgi:hypothetical protein
MQGDIEAILEDMRANVRDRCAIIGKFCFSNFCLVGERNRESV